MTYVMWILVALGILAGDAVNATQRPNIILLTVDTFRADRIGYYGNPRGPSPALDEFAREGVFFREAFNTSGWTSPGLISILTSLYAPTHAVDLRGRSMNPAVETLPEVLKAAGYRVPDIFFLSDIPNFAHLGLDPYPKRALLIHQGDEILFDWLREEAGKSEDPFFLYYHYRDVHQPYDAAPHYSKPYMDEAFGPLSPIFDEAEKIEGLTKAHISQRQVALMSPWMLVHRATADAFEAIEKPVEDYLSHWLGLIDRGITTSATEAELSARNAANRSAIFNPDVDPVWNRVEQLIGPESTSGLCELLRVGSVRIGS